MHTRELSTVNKKMRYIKISNEEIEKEFRIICNRLNILSDMEDKGYWTNINKLSNKLGIQILYYPKEGKWYLGEIFSVLKSIYESKYRNRELYIEYKEGGDFELYAIEFEPHEIEEILYEKLNIDFLRV